MENISSKQRSKMQKVGKNTKSVLVHEVQAMNNEKEPPSLGIAFDLARESLSCQLEQADALDNKANSLQQLAAPGLVGIDLVLLGVMLPLQRSLWILCYPRFTVNPTFGDLRNSNVLCRQE